MKRISLLLLAACAAFAVLSPVRSQAAAAVSFDFFYDELSPYGNWVDVDGYGYCFQPTVASGWRPYYDGGWVYTDDGWCWDTSEPWGWATYHYGRWANVRGCGWVWVPGYEWAPAWVSWRTSPSYIGWAPLPPEARWGGGGIRFGVSFGFDIGPSYYNFCSPRYFGYSNVGRYCAPWRNNVNIIEQTTNITNITNVVNNNTTIIRSGGPNYDFVRRNSGQPIRRAQIERVSNPAGLRKGGALKNDLRGDKLRVVSPKIANNRNAKPKNVAARASSKNVDRGWGDIKDQNRAKQLREKMKNEAQVAAKRPENRDRNANRPKNANVAANRPGQPNRTDKAAKTAANDRTRTGNGLKPFLAQDKESKQQTQGVRKPGQVTPNRQKTAGTSRPGQKSPGQVQRPTQQQRNADARRAADVDAARRQQPQTAKRPPQQVQRPTQQQLQRPAQMPKQRPPQAGAQRPSPQVQRPSSRNVQRPSQPQMQRPSQSRPQPQRRAPEPQQRPQQVQKKSDDRRSSNRPSQPQFQQRPSPRQPQMQRPSNGGGGNRGAVPQRSAGKRD